MSPKKNSYPGSPHVKSALDSLIAVASVVKPSYIGANIELNPHLYQAEKHIERAMNRSNPHAYGKYKPYSAITPEDHAGTVLSLNKAADSLTRATHEHPNTEDHADLHGHVSNIKLMAAKYHQEHVGGSHSERIKTQLNRL